MVVLNSIIARSFLGDMGKLFSGDEEDIGLDIKIQIVKCSKSAEPTADTALTTGTVRAVIMFDISTAGIAKPIYVPPPGLSPYPVVSRIIFELIELVLSVVTITVKYVIDNIVYGRNRQINIQNFEPMVELAIASQIDARPAGDPILINIKHIRNEFRGQIDQHYESRGSSATVLSVNKAEVLVLTPTLSPVLTPACTCPCSSEPATIPVAKRRRGRPIKVATTQ
ncbi:hypothetical protein BX661DRAFT_83662 [Kickxella alabastrina]|uniref:uncharacterized protein n=1 Tax=Kickxella alabastrina TaxID=61397 RepID=UPI0022211F0C|nr:uncharacterized protein BX661DRAFT_83662 [Kickxella alabastrina]KAI7819740.1 hypothetical protein BX661DRAFT_83662 [Kickxella alabastrina]